MRKAIRGAGTRHQKDELQAANKKYEAGKDPLEIEESLQVIIPTNEQEQEVLSAVIDKMFNIAGDDASKTALAMWKLQLQEKSTSAGIKFDFLRRFYFWLLGRGTQEDTDKTSWGRGNAAVLNPEVAAYIEQFSTKRLDYALKLSLLATRTPKTLNEYYLYFKYIVNGNIRRKTVLGGGDFWDMSNEDFLRDFEMMQMQFDAVDKNRTQQSYSEIIEPAATRTDAPSFGVVPEPFVASEPFPVTTEQKEEAQIQEFRTHKKQISNTVKHFRAIYGMEIDDDDDVYTYTTTDQPVAQTVPMDLSGDDPSDAVKQKVFEMELKEISREKKEEIRRQKKLDDELERKHREQLREDEAERKKDKDFEKSRRKDVKDMDIDDDNDDDDDDDVPGAGAIERLNKVIEKEPTPEKKQKAAREVESEAKRAKTKAERKAAETQSKIETEKKANLPTEQLEKELKQQQAQIDKLVDVAVKMQEAIERFEQGVAADRVQRDIMLQKLLAEPNDAKTTAEAVESSAKRTRAVQENLEDGVGDKTSQIEELTALSKSLTEVANAQKQAADALKNLDSTKKIENAALDALMVAVTNNSKDMAEAMQTMNNRRGQQDEQFRQLLMEVGDLTTKMYGGEGPLAAQTILLSELITKLPAMSTAEQMEFQNNLTTTINRTLLAIETNSGITKDLITPLHVALEEQAKKNTAEQAKTHVLTEQLKQQETELKKMQEAAKGVLPDKGNRLKKRVKQTSEKVADSANVEKQTQKQAEATVAQLEKSTDANIRKEAIALQKEQLKQQREKEDKEVADLIKEAGVAEKEEETPERSQEEQEKHDTELMQEVKKTEEVEAKRARDNEDKEIAELLREAGVEEEGSKKTKPTEEPDAILDAEKATIQEVDTIIAEAEAMDVAEPLSMSEKRDTDDRAEEGQPQPPPPTKAKKVKRTKK